MAPSPIPAPLPSWAKALLQLAPFIPAGLQEALEYIGAMSSVEDASPDAWMHIQLIGANGASTERADDFATTFDIVNITNGAIDSSWTQADTDTVKTLLQGMATDWAARMQVGYAWKEMRFYRRHFNGYNLAKPFAKSGPPQIVYPMTGAGAASSRQAPQVALTTTDRTAYPRHWGRNYWPMPGSVGTTTIGNAPAGEVDATANGLAATYTQLMAADFFPVVVVTQVDKIPTRGLLTVNKIQVDDVWDVVRRRRVKTATHKKILPV